MQEYPFERDHDNEGKIAILVILAIFVALQIYNFAN